MVNQEILGGLRNAVAGGESLREAMMSFYNSGYSKEEIEEAAHIVHQETIDRDIIEKDSFSEKPRAFEDVKKISDSEQAQEQIQSNTINAGATEMQKVKTDKELNGQEKKETTSLPIMRQNLPPLPSNPEIIPEKNLVVEEQNDTQKRKISKGMKIALIVAAMLAVLLGIFYLVSGVFHLF